MGYARVTSGSPRETSAQYCVLTRLFAMSCSLRSMSMQQVRPARSSTLRSDRARLKNHRLTCSNPGNALPLQDRSVEVWPRREYLHLSSGQALPRLKMQYIKASLYNTLRKVGSIACVTDMCVLPKRPRNIRKNIPSSIVISPVIEPSFLTREHFLVWENNPTLADI
jgi:hypothetical protein